MAISVKTTSWLIPCNTDYYDPFEAFSTLDTIDWRQSSQINVGDEVYVYCGKPHRAIMFKSVVIKSNIPTEEADKRDRKYYKGNCDLLKKVPRYGFMRLKLERINSSESLSLEELLQHGMSSAPQGPRRLDGKLLEYIEDCFH